jgi:endonuclease/exonuclease/phosphatase family metal-dependent hydrolase
MNGASTATLLDWSSAQVSGARRREAVLKYRSRERRRGLPSFDALVHDMRRSGPVLLAVLGAVRVFGVVTDRLLSNEEIHRVVGEPARIERRVPADVDLNVVTWNIERGKAYDKVLSVLRSLDPDIVLLQEADRSCRRTGYRDVARDLAHALEMNWVSAGEFQEVGEARGDKPALHGQAILSKFPIEQAEVLRFKAQARWRWSINPVQPRRGGRIALKARSAGLLLYNTHFESGLDERLRHKQVAELLDDQSRETGTMPVVIGGDFNNGPILQSSLLGSVTAASFADALGEAHHRGPTSAGQRHPIDWIFVRNLSPIHGRIVDAGAASDHFPLIAVLDAAWSPATAR